MWCHKTVHKESECTHLKKVCVCGYFGFGNELLNGQTVKTKTISNELSKSLGTDKVVQLDTHGSIKLLLRLPFQLFKAIKRCENIVVLPAQNGVRVIAPLLVAENIFFRRKLHYVVIGGWLPEFLQNKPYLSGVLKKFHHIYVETSTMKNSLIAQGFRNIVVMPNCKELKILEKSELIYPANEPYKLCTFSRVMREKGIEDAIEAVKLVNETCGRTIFTLDIYGQVDPNQIDWFESLRLSFPYYVKYNDFIAFDKSVEVLQDYYALLFPTRFYTEGIPGTIIDAYAAGIPVISSKWESFEDVVDDQVTGIGYEFACKDRLAEVLSHVAQYPDIINSMKPACITKAEKFVPAAAINIILRNI